MVYTNSRCYIHFSPWLWWWWMCFAVFDFLLVWKWLDDTFQFIREVFEKNAVIVKKKCFSSILKHFSDLFSYAFFLRFLLSYRLLRKEVFFNISNVSVHNKKHTACMLGIDTATVNVYVLRLRFMLIIHIE